MLITVGEGKKLILFTRRNVTPSYIERFEVWLVLAELYQITLSFSSSQHDRVLAWAANKYHYMKWMQVPGDLNYSFTSFECDALPRGEKYAHIPCPPREDRLLCWFTVADLGLTQWSLELWWTVVIVFIVGRYRNTCWWRWSPLLRIDLRERLSPISLHTLWHCPDSMKKLWLGWWQMIIAATSSIWQCHPSRLHGSVWQRCYHQILVEIASWIISSSSIAFHWSGSIIYSTLAFTTCWSISWLRTVTMKNIMWPMARCWTSMWTRSDKR